MARDIEGGQHDYIIDANVLIDFCNVDRDVLGLIQDQMGSLYVATPVLGEVDQLDELGCDSLEITLVEPTLDQVFEAEQKRGALSFQDLLCLILARDHGYWCITNDTRLRSECSERNIRVLWGLEPLVELVRKRTINPRRAIELALAIQSMNPRCISHKIIRRFRDRIGLSA